MLDFKCISLDRIDALYQQYITGCAICHLGLWKCAHKHPLCAFTAPFGDACIKIDLIPPNPLQLLARAKDTATLKSIKAKNIHSSKGNCFILVRDVVDLKQTYTHTWRTCKTLQPGDFKSDALLCCLVKKMQSQSKVRVLVLF